MTQLVKWEEEFYRRLRENEDEYIARRAYFRRRMDYNGEQIVAEATAVIAMSAGITNIAA
jgi:DNA-binding phage protein